MEIASITPTTVMAVGAPMRSTPYCIGIVISDGSKHIRRSSAAPPNKALALP